MTHDITTSEAAISGKIFGFEGGILLVREVGFENYVSIERNRPKNWTIIKSSDGIWSSVKDADEASSDHSASSAHFGYHYDGAYLPKPPLVCSLYCIDSGRGDTPTAFIDAHVAVNSLCKRLSLEVEDLELLDWTYIDRHGKLINAPLVQLHPYLDIPILRFGEQSGILAYKRGSSKKLDIELSHISDAINSTLSEQEKILQYWKDGDWMVWDNWQFLHARLATSSDRRRNLRRVWYDVKFDSF
ncbi:TauD/TfdA family dioxygenase [Novosphingobium naphthalenivorans]|uniref:TauD/TfdA family dioxygenase n=1 Tax=Novosphingobium naphthalenivorans TaxID=273168 RepID=UPI0009FFB7F8|nr:TauD/TfdA family dioxygenase [Novosphingobium naphthalenivorans]